MQDIMPPLGAGAQLIQSYGPAGFRIAGRDHATSVLVTPAGTVAWNGELTIDALAPVLNADPATEILIIGTGKRHELIAKDLRASILARVDAIDTMDTGAACRTFNILLGEGRRVAVALMLP